MSATRRRDATFIMAKSEKGILLLKRAPDHPLHPGQWTLPGGKRDLIGQGRCVGVDIMHAYPGGYGESLDQCAVEEFFEETGVKSKAFGRMPLFLVAREHIVYVYAIAQLLPEILPKEFPNREHVEYMWIEGEKDLPENTSDLVKHMFDETFEELLEALS